MALERGRGGEEAVSTWGPAAGAPCSTPHCLNMRCVGVPSWGSVSRVSQVAPQKENCCGHSKE